MFIHGSTSGPSSPQVAVADPGALKMKVAQQGIEEEAKEIMVLIEQEAARARAQEKARAGAVV